MTIFIVGDDQTPETEVPQPVCIGCDRRPEELAEYVEQGEIHSMSPSAFVCLFEGTLNRSNGHFLCTPCYIRYGSPSGLYPNRWIAP